MGIFKFGNWYLWELFYFPILPSQIAFTFLVYPALILAYMGQAAYLSKHHQNAGLISYYVSVPGIWLFVWLLHGQDLNYQAIWPEHVWYRKFEVARTCNSHSCFCCGKPSNHKWNILNHQPKSITQLFPKSQSCSYLRQDSWSNLHTRDQLDAHDSMYCRHHWFQRHQAHGKCIRYLPETPILKDVILTQHNTAR